jgi:hypothetical protein
MRLFIERFILAILAAFVVLLAVTNPLGFNWPVRLMGIIITTALAGIAAHLAGWEESRWQRLRVTRWLSAILRLSGGFAVRLLCGIFLFVVGGGIAAWQYFDVLFPAKGIVWLSEKFDETGYAFLSMTRKSDEQYRVIAFTAVGENRTGRDITNISGYVQSDITGEKFKLFVNIEGRRVPVADISNIPEGERFALESPFGPPEGIPSPKFLTDIGGVKFVFVYDGDEYKRDFASEKISAFIQRMEKASGYKPSRPILIK